MTRRSWLRSATAIAAAVLVALAVSTVPPVAAAPDVVMTPALQAKIQQLIEDFRTTHRIVGMTAAVVTPDPHGSGPVITHFASGAPAIGSPLSVDESTRFELGSETKTFTADLLAYLVASNLVSLDDEVQDYAPAGITVPVWVDPDSGDETPITLLDLATHQAGLPDPPGNFNDGCGGDPSCENPRPGYTQTMLWDGLEAQTLLWKPGTNWLYSNFGFGILGTILANVVQAVPITDPPAYQSAIDGAFVDALGLTSTELEPPGPDPGLAIPYNADGTPSYRWDNTNAISGAGGLISNATDMGVWVAAHLGYYSAGAPLGVQTLANTLSPYRVITTSCSEPSTCAPVTGFQMGLAWELNAADKQDVGVPWAFKNGGTAGSSSDTAMAATLGIGVTTMFNKKRVDGDEVAVPILKLLVAETRLPATGPSELWVVVLGLGAVSLLALGAVLTARRRSTAWARSGG